MLLSREGLDRAAAQTSGRLVAVHAEGNATVMLLPGWADASGSIAGLAHMPFVQVVKVLLP
jgi:hypothetical protein